MCGIAGQLSFSGNEPPAAAIEAMAQTMVHRGPDDVGFYRHGPVGFGFRRLSIIDLQGGHQPLFNEDQSLALILNGEIYNYKELRAQLREQGHRFATDSDAEVVLHLYEDHGDDCLDRLRGMFGFALFDKRRERLLLARDRVGIKPLYYCVQPQCLWFGSEMKAVLADTQVPQRLDLGFLDDYLSYGYGLHPKTAFQAIRILPAAHLLTARAGDPSSVQVQRYWSPPAPEPHSLSEEEWVDALQRKLAESVRLHMRSDVPYGAFLSGGLDSSTIVALMAEQSDEPVRTFSIGFSVDEVTELPYARQIAKKYATRHKERIVDPTDIDIVEALVDQFDEPFADCSALPTYLVSKIAAEEVKVILSGDGGDELFGGYNKYSRALGMADRFGRLPPILRQHVARALAERWPFWLHGRGFLRRLSQDANGRLLQDGTFFDTADKRALLHPDLHRQLEQQRNGENAFARFLDQHSHLDDLSRFELGDLHYYLVDDILQKVDRCSMAHSLEVRVPLLDHEVVELAFRMPSDLKIRNGVKKQILRRAFGDKLTPDVLSHRKQGFFAPIDQWFRDSLLPYATDRLLSRDSALRDLLRPGFVRRILHAHRFGLRNLSERIWCLVILEAWARRHPL
jgi:asparagine synthase (glutamine-hydrolysing)